MAPPIFFWANVLGFCAQTMGLGAHFCTNDAQTFGTLKNQNIQCGGATVSMAPPNLFLG